MQRFFSWRDAMRYMLLGLLMIFAAAAVARANPSDKQPWGSLDVHNAEFAPELLDTAQKLSQKNQDALAKFEKNIAAGRVASVDALEVGNAYLAAMQMRRAGEQLVQLGEPAGVDFLFRSTLQMQALQKVVMALKSLPQASQGVTAFRGRAQNLASQRQKQLLQIQKRMEDKKWEEAERMLLGIVDELTPLLTFLPSDEAVQIMRPYNEIRGKIESEMRQQRLAIARERYAKRREMLAPDFDKLLKQMQEAAAEVGKSGKYSLDGQERTGPELIAAFDQAWQKAHVAALRVWALDAAAATLADPLTHIEPSPVREAYTAFAAAAGPALAAIIAADAARVDAAAVEKLYAEYLPAVADLLDHASGAPALEKPLQASLDMLVAKSPALAARVNNYRAATEELLRWRARIATEQAQAKQAEYPRLAAKLHAALAREGGGPGLFDPQPVSTAAATLTTTAGEALSAGAPKIVGQKVMLEEITALPGSREAGIARFRDRLYGRVTLLRGEKEQEALLRELQISDTQPALCLRAAQAARSAERGDVVAAGGMVSGVFLEGQVTRFATLPESAALLLPLGTLPPDHSQLNQLEQMVLRLDVAPAWVQHRYFLVEAPAE